MRRNHFARTIVIVTVVLLVLAVTAPVAVAGGRPAGKTPPEVPGFDGETIKLGVITPLSGLAAVIGRPLTNGNKVYWDAVNADGGVAGKYKVELVQEDSEYQVEAALQGYDAIKDEVVAFQQILGTQIVLATQRLLKANQQIGGPATLDSLWVKAPDLFPIGAPYQIEAINGFDYYINKAGGKGKKVCAIAQDDAYGDAGLQGLSFAAKQLKFKVATTVRFATGSDVSAQVNRLADADCEAVFLASTPNDTVPIVTKMIGRNFEPQILGLAPTWLAGLAGSADLQQFLVDHFWVLSEGPAWGDTSVPGMNQLIEDLNQYSPDQAPDQYFAFGYAQAWAADQILEQAVKNGDLGTQGLRQAMNQVGTLKFGGLVGNYKYGKSPTDRNPPRATNVFKVAPGQPVGVELLQPNFASAAAKKYKFPNA